jgi:hypothetical protein
MNKMAHLYSSSTYDAYPYYITKTKQTIKIRNSLNCLQILLISDSNIFPMQEYIRSQEAFFLHFKTQLCYFYFFGLPCIYRTYFHLVSEAFKCDRKASPDLANDRKIFDA